jgi:hypothetical protein
MTPKWMLTTAPPVIGAEGCAGRTALIKYWPACELVAPGTGCDHATRRWQNANSWMPPHDASSRSARFHRRDLGDRGVDVRVPRPP